MSCGFVAPSNSHESEGDAQEEIYVTCPRVVRQYRKASEERQMLTLPLENARAKITFPKIAERCESGRIDMLGKHASRQRDRGFESHPLRQAKLARPGASLLRRRDRHLEWSVLSVSRPFFIAVS